MFSHSNEFAYAKEFDGNLQAKAEPVPVKVTTRLRLMNQNTAREIRQYSDQAFDLPPQYVFGGGNLPLRPSLQAVGATISPGQKSNFLIGAQADRELGPIGQSRG
jgi:hypothetical protein